MATAKTPSSISAPDNITSTNSSDVSSPSSPSSQSKADVGSPEAKAAQTTQTVNSPSGVNPQIKEDVAAPTSKTSQDADAVASPNQPSAANKALINSPSALAVNNALSIPRTLNPLIDLDFGAALFAQAGVSKNIKQILSYSRPSSATFINRRINNLGRYEYFLDTDYVGDVENFVTYSEQLDHADWTKANTAEVIPNKSVSSDGTKNADLVYAGTTGVLRGVFNSISGRNTNKHTTSFDLKAAGVSWVRVIGASGSAGAWFNLDNGTIGTSSSLSSPTIKFLGGGWYRCSVSNPGTATSFAQLVLADGDNTDSVTANGIDGVYVSRAQLTESSKPLPYVKTLSSAVTETFSESIRREYDPLTGQALGALVEGGSTNLALYSEEFDNASWSKTNSTVTANQTIAPDGTASADKYETNGSDNIHQDINVVSGTDYAFSFYIKAGNVDVVTLVYVTGFSTSTATFDLSSESVTGETGTVVDSSISSVGDGWYRVSTVNQATSTVLGEVRLGLDSSTPGDFCYIWGAQLEALPFPTSYIRTEGSTVSRSADFPVFGNSIIPLGDLTAFVEFDAIGNDSGAVRQVLNSVGDNSATFGVRVRDNEDIEALRGQNTPNFATSGWNYDQFYKTAFSYNRNLNELDLYFDGVPILSAQDGGTTYTELTSNVGIGVAGGSSTGHLFGHIRRLAIYDLALTAQEVALL